MTTCEAANEAAALCRHMPSSHIGIHLTLTSSENLRIKPVYQKHSLDSLVTKDGYFPRDISQLEQHADPEQVRLELKAQINKALAMGIDPTHLDSHGGSVFGLAAGCDFLEVVLDLCEQYRLPFHLPRRIVEHFFLASSRVLAGPSK
ncbi:ChbG/HpnK family deacetylase [Paenibacillus tarimensis]